MSVCTSSIRPTSATSTRSWPRPLGPRRPTPLPRHPSQPRAGDPANLDRRARGAPTIARSPTWSSWTSAASPTRCSAWEAVGSDREMGAESVHQRRLVEASASCRSAAGTRRGRQGTRDRRLCVPAVIGCHAGGSAPLAPPRFSPVFWRPERDRTAIPAVTRRGEGATPSGLRARGDGSRSRRGNRSGVARRCHSTRRRTSGWRPVFATSRVTSGLG